MRVLVIGGSGHVGTIVLPYLAERHDVAVLDLKPPVEGVPVDYHAGDLRDAGAVGRAAAGTDAVLFMAMGPSTGWGTAETALAHLDVAVGGLYVALDAARQAGVRHAVYTSSMSVYTSPGAASDGRTRFPDESVPPDATNAYGLAKRLGEQVCANAVAAWDMSVVALRLCHPVADVAFPRRDHGPLAPIISTSARDTARALLAALDFRGHGFEAFCISGDGAERALSITKAREILGWQPLDRTDQVSTS